MSMRYSPRGRIRLLELLLLLAVPCAAQEIRVCLYEGPKPSPEALRSYLGRYRGTVYLTRNGTAWCVVNRLDIEEYLYGVVSREMGRSWPEEALKAQAVCSRTFALRKLAESSAGAYDIKSSSAHQVFDACEDEQVIRAVEMTRREVLVTGSPPALFPVHFHTCCGGSTSTPDSVWGGQAVFGACSVQCEECAGSKYASWERKIPKALIGTALGLASVHSVQAGRMDAGGRVLDLKVRTKSGTVYSVSGNALRLGLYARAGDESFGNPRTLPSMRCTLTDAGDAVVFRGSGFGHGVGMCQMGARAMAEKGRSYRDILEYFFPHASLAVIEEEGEPHGDTAVHHGAP